jgi:predicted amidohydrolase
VVIDAYGHTLAMCVDSSVSTASAQLDMEALRRFREKFPVLRDSDVFVEK